MHEDLPFNRTDKRKLIDVGSDQLLRCDKDGRELRGEGGGAGGRMAQWLAYLLPDPAGLGLILSITDIFDEEKMPSAALRNWLENVDKTYL